MAFAGKLDPKMSKLASRAFECVFIGYAYNSKAYRFYDLKNHVITESNDVDFFENNFPFKSRNCGASTSIGTHLGQVNQHSLFWSKLIPSQVKVKELK